MEHSSTQDLGVGLIFRYSSLVGRDLQIGPLTESNPKSVGLMFRGVPKMLFEL